ncbi:MAG TPA: hypothetical protein VEQ60_05385, partial [Longimicrobium sp.]|nr:hypothetical protein [Longimicrobium sp.]
MKKQSGRPLAGWLTVALIVALVLVYFLAPASNARFKDAAAALAFITGAAVAIERIIEGFWTFVGGVSSGYWPLNRIREQVNQLESELDTALGDTVTDAAAALAAAGKTAGEVALATADLNNRLVQTKAGLAKIRSLAPDNQRAQMLATLAAKHLAYVQSKYPDVEKATKAAAATIDGLQDFVASFKDNPGRRMISLYLGAMLGLAVAGSFGLDVFEAAMQAPPVAAVQQPAQTNPREGAAVQELSGDQSAGPRDTEAVATNSKEPSRGKRWQIILTGLIMGLGSSPTHEVIRAIQEYKKTRKGANIGKPNQP